MRGNTIIERIVTRSIDEKFSKDPELHSTCLQVLQRIKSGTILNPEMIDAVVQPWRRDLDVYDAHCITQFWGEVYAGNILVKLIDLGSEPHEDKNKSGNNELLRNLPLPFRGEFWGGRGTTGEDGIIQWSGSLNFIRHIDPEDPDKVEEVLTKCSRMPLEVGYIDGAKMLEYVSMPGTFTVARWPYQSSKIWLFDAVTPNVMLERLEAALAPCFENVERPTLPEVTK